MNVIWTVMRKELLDLFRDRRTVMLGLFMGPLLFPALILGVGALAESRARTQLDSTLELPVIGVANAPNLVAFLATRNIDVIDPPEDPEAAIRNQQYEVILSIPDDYPELWRGSRPALVEILYDSSRQDSRIPVSRVEGALRGYSQQVSTMRLLLRGVDPALGGGGGARAPRPLYARGAPRHGAGVPALPADPQRLPRWGLPGDRRHRRRARAPVAGAAAGHAVQPRRRS
jgi:sodium transport system permease protein